MSCPFPSAGSCERCQKPTQDGVRFCSENCRKRWNEVRRGAGPKPRPASITCPCGTLVPVGPMGMVPSRCPKCRKERQRAQTRAWKQQAEHPLAGAPEQVLAAAEELAEGRKRLSCQLENLRGQVVSLARSLGLPPPA